MNRNYLVRFLTAGILCGMLNACVEAEVKGRYRHVEMVEIEVPPAPEIRGADGYQKPNTKNWRLAASVQVGSEEDAKISGLKNKPKSCRETAHCESSSGVQIQEDVDATYRTTGPIFNADFEFLRKYDLLLWSWGVGWQQGPFGKLSFGVNTRWFEFGGFFGLWTFYRDAAYGGGEYRCVRYYTDTPSGPYHLEKDDFDSHSTSLGIALLYGGYASVYWKSFSLTYSANFYRPNMNYSTWTSEEENYADFELPIVITEYIMLGYRLTDHVTLRAGASNVFGDFKGWHWAFKGGVVYDFR